MKDENSFVEEDYWTLYFSKSGNDSIFGSIKEAEQNRQSSEQQWKKERKAVVTKGIVTR